MVHKGKNCMNIDITLLKKEHLVYLAKIRNEPEVRKFLRQVKECTEDGQLAWFESSKIDNTRVDFTILCDMKVVGSCIVRDIDLIRKHCEVGWFVSHEFQGKGIGIKSCKKMLKFVFNDFQMESCYAFVYSDNLKGISFAYKLGMKKAGELRNRRIRDNIYINEIIFDITRGDFYD